MTPILIPGSGPVYTDGSIKPLPDARMTALFVSFLVWAIVAFMAVDKGVRVKEKRALLFFAFLGTTLTVIGLWQFEVTQLTRVSPRDWVLVGFFPVFVLGLFLRSKLIKLQSRTTGRARSMLDLNLADVPDRKLVRQFLIVNTMVWLYAAVIILVQVGLVAG